MNPGNKISKNIPKRILIFSQIDNVRMTIRRAIKEMINPEIAETHQEKAAIKSCQKTSFDIFFFDWDKFNGNKINLLQIINENTCNPNWGVVVVSSDFDKTDIRSAIENGAKDFILKPFSAETIQKKVSRYFGNRRNQISKRLPHRSDVLDNLGFPK